MYRSTSGMSMLWVGLGLVGALVAVAESASFVVSLVAWSVSMGLTSKHKRQDFGLKQAFWENLT